MNMPTQNKVSRVEHFSGFIDELFSDLVITPVFDDDEAPVDITGLLDWRMNYFISHSLLNGFVSGKFGETALIPVRTYLPMRRIMLVGLGTRSGFKLSKIKGLSMILAKKIQLMKAIDVAIRILPAIDEQQKNETQKVLVENLRRNLTSEVLIRTIDSKVQR